MKLKPFHLAGLLAALLLLLTIGLLRADLPPDAQELVNKGINAAKQQDYIQAISFFQDARKIAPNAPDIYFNLGLVESKISGRELRAICWFEVYLAANPNAPNAAAVKEQVDALDVKSHNFVSQAIQSVQDAAAQQPANGLNYWYNFSKVASMRSEIGAISDALKIADQIQDEIYKNGALAGIANDQAKAGDIPGALKTADLIREQAAKNDAINDIAYFSTKLASAQTFAGDITGALTTLDLTTNMSEDKDLDYESIAEDQAKANDIIGAQKTAGSIHISIYKDRALSGIAEAQAKADDIMGAQKTAGSIQDSFYVNSTQKTIAEAQAKVGDITNALKTVGLLEDAGPNKQWKSDALQSIVADQANAGDFTGALKTADLLQDAGPNQQRKSGALQSIVADQANAGDFTGALKTADLLQDAGPNQQWKSGALKSIADAQARVGNITNALKTIDLLQDAGINQQWKSFAQQSIAQIQSNAGDITGALKTVALIQDASFKPNALQFIAVAQAKAGDIPGALKTVDLLQDANLKINAEKAIAESQKNAGNFAGAKENLVLARKTAESIQDMYNKCMTLCGIAVEQSQAGDITNARETLIIAEKNAAPIDSSVPRGSSFEVNRDSVLYDITIDQINVGDFAGALNTANLIRNPSEKSSLQADIVINQQKLVEAKTKSVSTNAPTYTSSLSTASQNAIPAIPVSDLLSDLDDTDKSHHCALNTDPFLDLASYLKSLPHSDDPQKAFDSLYNPVDTIATAQNIIDQMLKKQAKP